MVSPRRSSSLLIVLACCCAGVSCLRALPSVALNARRGSSSRAYAVAVTTSATASKLLAEFAKDTRSLPMIEGALKELESAELPKKLKKGVIGDWKLAFASDEEAAAMLLTGEANVLLAVEAVIASFNEGSKMRSIEVTRPFGPFGNRKAALEGRWGLEDNKLGFKYQYVLEETQGGGTRERDVPEAAKERREVEVTHVSDGLLVLRRSASSYLVLSKLKSLRDELIELRVEAPPAPPEDAKSDATPAAATPAPSLPGMPKMPSLPDPKALLSDLQKQADKLKG